MGCFFANNNGFFMGSKYSPLLLLSVVLLVTSCAVKKEDTQSFHLRGQWITQADGSAMLDPQTSGLISWQGQLLTISDGSAHESQRLALHKMSADTARLAAQSFNIRLSESVKQSCFAEYLSVRPDLEALVAVAGTENEFISVTEDASHMSLTAECQQRYANSGSTDYPTVLVRLVLQPDNSLLMSHIRPIQYQTKHAAGNYPNDGIEGLAYGPDSTLYLGLEKDAAGQPRIFSVKIAPDFWTTQDYAQVTDPELATPTFEKGNHPINGLEYFAGFAGGKGFLLAAARNDNQLWIIDLDKQRLTRILDLNFEAPAQNQQCPEWQIMHNASIEGIAVAGDNIWMVNDPWKQNYLKNVQCQANKNNYERMAPLLFKLPIKKHWFE